MGSQLSVYVKEINSQNYFELTLDQKFPSKTNRDIEFDIKPNSGLQKFRLDPSKTTQGKIMLTFVSNDSDFAEVKFMVLKGSQVFYVNPGEQ